MEKRLLLAALLSALFVAWYTQIVLRSPGAKGHSSLQTTLNRSVGEPINEASVTTETSETPLVAEESIVILSSKDLSVEVGQTSGSVRRATLKGFKDVSKTGNLQVGGYLPLIHFRIAQEAALSWSLESEHGDQVVLHATGKSGNSYELSYGVRENTPVLNILMKIRAVPEAESQINKQISITNTWSKADSLSNRNNQLEAHFLINNGTRQAYKRYIAPIREHRIVPHGTKIVALTERYFCQIIKTEVVVQSMLLPSINGTIISQSSGELALDNQNKELSFAATVYIGPRDYFHLQKAGFEKAFRIGILEQIGLILLMALKAIAKVTGNYGVAIIVFSIGITTLMSPFTLLSFRSMKKMQELKPKMDRIYARHKDNQQKANEEMLALYREHRVNPLGGCLPIFLQMPIFFALFQTISHFIELRGQQFLWIFDLSLPDRLYTLPFTLPIIGKYLNLLPLVMAVVMYFQTKMSQRNAGVAEGNPSMKMMSGPIMPVIFGIMFYQFPAGLVLYWLTNSLMSLVFYKLAART